jgi:hypothetical protein
MIVLAQIDQSRLCRTWGPPLTGRPQSFLGSGLDVILRLGPHRGDRREPVTISGVCASALRPDGQGIYA